MVLRSAQGLQEFCRDLASPEPSPGGGTAAAAAGAIAASLLTMVCGITLKSKKHEQSWDRLEVLRRGSEGLSSRLLSLAAADASAYDRMVEAGRAERQRPDDTGAVAAYAEAIKRATEAPMSTAEACVDVLRLAKEVDALGTKSASSDVEVAEHLASAGAKGALANVRINLPYCREGSFVELARANIMRVERELDGLGAP